MMGNAQMIGQRAVQSNYFITDIRANGTLAVLADGTIDSVNGMRAAVLCCDTIRASFRDNWFSDDLFYRCHRNITDRIYRGRTPRVSLMAVWVYEEQFSFRQIGNQRLYLTSDKNMELISEAEGVKPFGSNNSLLMQSRGVFDTLNEVEMGNTMALPLEPYDKAQKLLEQVRYKNKRMQENATIVILKRG